MRTYAEIMPDVARVLWGPPNRRFSTLKRLRWGSNGSRCVNVEKGTWYDHERKEGGGVLDLLKREGHGPEWLEAHGFGTDVSPTNGYHKSSGEKWPSKPAPRPKERETPAHPVPSRIVATYDYVDRDGNLTYQVVRRDPKDFRQRRPDGKGGWIWDLQGIEPTLYRLDQLIAAIAAKHVVYVVEGEKDVETLGEVGLTGTCNSGGAGKWNPQFGDFFVGADVILIPDNDDAGRNHAQGVARSLIGKAKRVRILALPGLPEKGDVSDWFCDGGTREKLWELGDTAPEWKAAAGDENGANRKNKRPPKLIAGELQDMTFNPLKWVVRGLLPEGLTLLIGKPKLGKSWMCLEIATAVSRGTFAFGETECMQGDVLYLALEDSARRLQRRLRKLLADTEWPQRLEFWTECPRADTGGIDCIREWLSEHPEARLVIVDILGRFRPAAPQQKEQLYDRDYQAGEALQALAAEFNVAILLVHHARKAVAEDPLDTVSGTTGLAAVADAVMVLTRTGESITLDVRGRDIEEVSMAMQFNRDNCRWTIQGNAAEVKRSDARNAILAVLLEADEPMSDGNIATAIGNKRVTTATLLRKMVQAGEVSKIKRGRYVHPSRSDLKDAR